MGRSIALLLAERGASVLVNDYGGDEFGNPGTSREAEAVVAEIRAAGGKAIASSVTVGDGAGADAIVNAALAAFGRVDVLINNAGGSTIAPLDDLTDAALERVMRTNYWGAYMLIRRVWPHMRTQQYGRIINVCSSAVLGIGTIAPYSSAKGAMVGLTHEAAIEGKPHDILVNGTFPAGYSRLAAKSAEDARRWMETYFQPEFVAQAYAYFASHDMQHTGEHLQRRRRTRLAHRLRQQRRLFQSGPHARVRGAEHRAHQGSDGRRARRQLMGGEPALSALRTLDRRT
jgi:NAD(P)-dependent dehydrogenase (short-subunit alcohol dehydrogenase family)